MRWREWLGVGERRWKKAPDEEVQPAKTLWDWLQLLIVPAILVGVTFMWSASQTRSDNKREDRRIAADRAAAEEARQDATLQGYLDEMSGLMLREKLLASSLGSAVRAVAGTVTLTALRRLDEQRKGEVVRFLYEAGLLYSRGSLFADENDHPLVTLEGADLRGADIGDAYLQGADLTDADLTGANLVQASLAEANLLVTNLDRAQLADAFLEDATLVNAHLVGAFLADAILARADLRGADLRRADLQGADLQGASLRIADLRRADLQGANLRGARLGGARLGGADLRGANLVGAKLVGAKLVEATPDGFRLAEGLDLGRYIADLTPKQQKAFLDSQEAFLDSLSREDLSKFKLTPEKLANFRREARS